MTEIEFPPGFRARWPDILKAAAEIGGWFDGYVGERSALMGSPGAGRRPDDAGDFPSEPPALIPVFGEGDDWKEFPHKAMYADERDFEQGTPGHAVVARGWEFNFGSFSVFRVTREQSEKLSEGYEDSAGTDNERIIEDGDHRIVVYMK